MDAPSLDLAPDHHDNLLRCLTGTVRVVWAVGALTLMTGLTSCGMATGTLSDRLELATTHTAAGPTIKATLVIYNPGFAMNLTQTGGCEPYFAVFLSSARATQEIGFDKDCQSTPLVIAHGTTRFPFTVETTYTTCGPPGNPPDRNSPLCLSGGAFPPLPSGRYKATVIWSEKVPLPTAAPVPVTIVG
jgi:hypothetical protein